MGRMALVFLHCTPRTPPPHSSFPVLPKVGNIGISAPQDTDIPVQKHNPFIHVHVYLRGVRLRPTCVTLYIERIIIRASMTNE